MIQKISDPVLNMVALKFKNLNPPFLTAENML